MQLRIDVIPTLVWKPTFPSTYKQLKTQIMKIIITELDTGSIVHSKSSNSIVMFTQRKRDKRVEARFLLGCMLIYLVTHKNETLIPSMEQFKDFIGYRPLRSNLDLTDGYHNIRIHPNSVSYTTFTCQTVEFDTLVMQPG